MLKKSQTKRDEVRYAKKKSQIKRQEVGYAKKNHKLKVSQAKIKITPKNQVYKKISLNLKKNNYIYFFKVYLKVQK